MPVSNGGTLPSMFAQNVLNELDDLGQIKTNEQKILLREKATGEIIQSTNESKPNIFFWTAYNKLNYGIDKDGFFILKNSSLLWIKKTRKVFSSTNFKQINISKDRYQFIDILTKTVITAEAKIYPYENEKSSMDMEFTVTKENVLIQTEYNYIIDPLYKLANAAIESGNPIVWC